MKFKDLPHDSAVSHVSGTSEFIDDRPKQAGELWVEVVYSTVAHGDITHIDTKAAIAIEGVKSIYSYLDLASNRWGSIVKDQPLLAEKTVHYIGEPILVIAAVDKPTALAAKAVVKIDITAKQPVLNLKQARAQRRFMGETYCIETGDSAAEFAQAEHLLTGQFINGGQEQFYLESQASIVYPEENNCLHVHVSAQHPTEVQHVVASALGLKQHQVVATVKRMGGGFGGKESQSAHYAALAALVAHKTKKPARLVLSKDDDMIVTGKRHPFCNDYQVAFDHQGKLQALNVDFYTDGGAYIDLTPAILQRAMFHVDNAYYLPHARITGTICQTHTHPHTAFRGFGGPQGAAVIEHIMEEIALHLDIDALDVRKINCYQGNEQQTHYGQTVDHNVLPELFEQIERTADYRARRKSIKQFNQQSTGLIKGLALSAVKFGISFTTRFLNQGNALVNVHVDGTVQVSTGATEMGQGVNSKIRKVVSEALGVAETDVRLMPTSTEKNANTSATAASSGSDINCAAAANACHKITARLANIASQLWAGFVPSDEHELCLLDGRATDHIEFKGGQVINLKQPSQTFKFNELVGIAYLNRISLSDYGHYKTPEIYYDKAKGKGRPFLYFTNGVAASEVSIDSYTGEVKILRTDLLMDLGRMINDGIDHGQVAGGFVQGAGWVTTENLYYSDQGKLLSHSPTTYKIPSIHDTPRIFNIDFIENHSNVMNIRGSKAVGEPPLLLGLSVWCAIKDALRNAGLSDTAGLCIPATSETILMNLSGQMPEQVL
ncbi:xanthine dehydrogenase molybdopterin binding subunit [Marinicella litoralis]|uniref:Xanthine dehydrogenase molybdenum binding subunit apoprotein n=1 Tax=Marinicella litoralis TaxID=644220 RepID=A0A4R6XLZ1_9GAMM|nr:xanthine dehydrogenase molybdopterin binding subunit [Marinicella litoralis]TDR20662.1 xanthine dehydrogenase molybdenum binding subunit apoprotein [Marinicella litoralis]